jgi:hypothetical protein
MKLTPGTKLKYVGAVFNKINETHNPSDGVMFETTIDGEIVIITIKPEILYSGGNLIPRLHFHMEYKPSLDNSWEGY